MIKFKAKLIKSNIDGNIDDDIIKVKSKYKGDLEELQLEMIGIMTEFGMTLAKKGLRKEEVEEELDNILRLSKENIKYKEV